MNLDMLHAILRDCTVQLRKGPVIETRSSGGVDVVEVFAMPSAEEFTENGYTKYDMVFLDIAVKHDQAQECKADLIKLLDEWPNPDELSGGPSYMSVGGTIGDQGAAFELFALGKYLGLWDIITPAKLGITDPDKAREMAGAGFIMCTGYRKKVAA